MVGSCGQVGLGVLGAGRRDGDQGAGARAAGATGAHGPIMAAERTAGSAALSGATTTVCAAEMPSTSKIARRSATVALDHRERDRAVLVVPRHRGQPARPRARRAAPAHPRVRQHVPRPVEVQEDQPPRRPAEVVHPGDRLLAAVAALVQVHGGAQPVDLVRRWCGGRSRSPSRGRHAATRSASAAQVPASGRSPTAATRSAAGHDELAPGAARCRGGPSTGPYAAVSPTRPGHGSRQASGSPGADSAPSGSPSTAQSAVTSATSTRSMKRIESSHADERRTPCPARR